MINENPLYNKSVLKSFVWTDWEQLSPVHSLPPKRSLLKKMKKILSDEEKEETGPSPVSNQELRHQIQVVDALVRDMSSLLSTTTENCVELLHAYRYAGHSDLLGHTLTEEESGWYYDWYGLLFPPPSSIMTRRTLPSTSITNLRTGLRSLSPAAMSW